MIKKFPKNESGFTLIEAIIYIAIFVMLSALLIDSLVVISKAYDDVRVNRDMLSSVNTSMERIAHDIKSASSWVSGSSNSVFATSPGKLTIKNFDNTTEVFELISGDVQFTDQTGYVSNLTGSHVFVDSLIFRDISTANSKAVKIEITMHSLRYPSAKSLSLSDTVVLRGSY